MKYLFFDLDGTLLNSEKIITNNTKNYLYLIKKQGYILGVASGRSINGVEDALYYSDANNLFDVIISSGGADIHDLKENRHYKRNYISPNMLKLILDDLKEKPELTIVFHNSPYLYASKHIPRIDKIVAMNRYKGFINPYENEAYFEAPKLLVLLPNKNRDELKEYLRNKKYPKLIGYLAEDEIYEFVDENNLKSIAISDYVNIYGDSLEDVMCFGDSENDIDMLEAAKVGVCMKNGEKLSKQVADYITNKSNDEDGIIHFLQRYFEEVKECQEKK
jgi:Cof subfamily protein (haloacid dehalogenase superfamily)